MISVDPIRDEQKIQTMKSYLKGKSLRDHALFVVGINVALRITDLLALAWREVGAQNERPFLLSASRLLIHFFKHKNHPILEWCVSAHCSKNRTMIYFCCCTYFSSFGFWFCFLLLSEFICFLRALFFVLRHFYNLPI